MANTQLCTTKVDYDQDSTIKSVDTDQSSVDQEFQNLLKSACGGVDPIAGQTTKTVSCPANMRNINDPATWTYIYDSYSTKVVSNPHKRTYPRQEQAEKNENLTSLTPGCQPCNVVQGTQRAVTSQTVWVETDNKDEVSTTKFPIRVSMDIKWLPQGGSPPTSWSKDRLSHIDKLSVRNISVALKTNTKTYSRNGSYNMKCVCIPY